MNLPPLASPADKAGKTVLLAPILNTILPLPHLLVMAPIAIPLPMLVQWIHGCCLPILLDAVLGRWRILQLVAVLLTRLALMTQMLA